MLMKMAATHVARRLSPYYVPAPWGDKELGETIETGESPTRRARLARKNARRTAQPRNG